MRRGNDLLIIAAIFFLVFLSSCAFPTFTNYEGLPPSDQQVAILEHSGFYSPVTIILRGEDGTLVYDASRDGTVATFKLTPGTYIIVYSYIGYKIREISRADTVELKAAHTYRVKIKAKGGFATVWIEEATTGQVVAGEKWK